MCRIRSFEIRAGQLFDEGLIHGPVHSYVGMEAIAVGVCSALGPDDLITSTHRGHGHCIAKGLDLRSMMAEILGREDGYCRGHGGSMHITAIDKGMLGADAIVAGLVGDRGRCRARPAAPGQGRRDGLLLRRRRGEPGHPPRGVQPRRRARRARSCSCARTTSGRSRRRSRPSPGSTTSRCGRPATASPAWPSTATTSSPCAQVAADAVERARAGDGPTLIEAKSYRIEPHSAARKTDLRSPAELDEWRARDPILRFRGYLVEERGDRAGPPRRARGTGRGRRRRGGRGGARLAEAASRVPSSRTSTRRPHGSRRDGSRDGEPPTSTCASSRSPRRSTRRSARRWSAIPGCS